MMPPLIQAATLDGFARAVFEALGLPAQDAGIVAGLMTEAELQGSDGHGFIRLPQYARRIRAGGVNTRPNITILRERAGIAVLDGDNAMGHLVMSRAAELAVAKARIAGVGWVGARRSNHAGPASLYARMALPHDMIGLYFAVGNANHMPPWGGLDMLLSTNPIAVAVPAAAEPPIVLDMATTVAAYGKVKAKALQGESLPLGWMMDERGQPLTDPARAEEGFLLPLGGLEAGYKGAGLALVIGLLAGTLNGAAMGRDVIDFNHDDSSETNTGQAIMAIDIAAFDDPAAFKSRVDALARDLRASRRLPGVAQIRLPGESSAALRAARARDGVPVTPALREKLDALADELGIDRLGDS